MKIGLVSIIIPSYNGSDKVIKAVRSILNQTYKAVEVIVVDDNGKGTQEQIKTENTVKEFEKYDNFRYITHDVNKNGSAARNTGAKASCGEYLGFLDDDDEYLPHYVKMHVEEHKRLSEDYALTYCSSAQYRNGKLVKILRKKDSGYLLYRVLMHKTVIGSTSLIIKRSAFEALGGFDESFRRHQDWEFTARVASKYKVKAVEEVGFKGHLEYRNSPKSYEISKNYRMHYVEKMMPYIQRLPKNQQKNVIVENYMSLILPLLRQGKVKEFISEFKFFNLGIRGVVFLIRDIFAYLFVNKNFWTLAKRK